MSNRLSVGARCSTALGIVALLGSLLAGQAQNKPVELEGAADGVLVRVSSARWAPVTEYSQNEHRFREPGQRVLLIGYNVEPTKDEWDPGKWRSLSRKLELLDANGEPVRGDGGSSWGEGKGREWWGALDPRTRKATLLFEFRHPSAPPEASGESTDSLSFKGVVLPVEKDKPLDVKQTLTTKRGTTVVLQSVELRSAEKARRGKDSLWLTFHATTAARVRDMIANVYLSQGGARDDTGADLTGNSSSGADTQRLGEITKTSIPLQVLPAAGAKTMDVELKVSERAQSERQEKWYRQVRIPFDPSALPVVRDGGKAEPVATAQSEHVEATLQSLGAVSSPRLLEAVVWLKKRQLGTTPPPKTAAAGSRETDVATWLYKGWTVRDAQGREHVEENAESFAARPAWWKPDGSPVQVGEDGRRLTLQNPSGDDKPDKVSLVLQVQAVRGARHTADFSGISFPAKAGDMVTVKKIVKMANGDQVILWKVGRFDTQHPIPANAPYSPSGKPMDWEGLVLVFEYRPQTQILETSRVRFRDLKVADNDGRALRGVKIGEHSHFGSHDGDVWRNYKILPNGRREGFSATQRTWWSLYTELPAPGAKSLRVLLQVDAQNPLTPVQTITFADVAVTPRAESRRAFADPSR